MIFSMTGMDPWFSIKLTREPVTGLFWWKIQALACRCRVSVVSLEIPGIVVSLEIPVFQIFSRRKPKKIKKICFLDSRDQNKILNFLWFFYMTRISYKNPHFLAPSPLKHLKSISRYQNLTGEPLTVHSDPKNHRKRPESTYVDLCFLNEPILGPLKARFDQLDR